ncbi:MAG: O-antigen ligase family protein [Patescibacteria group bacterium]
MLIIIFSLAFLWLSIKKPLWGAYFIFACLPAYLIRFQINGLPLTLLETMILIFFLALILTRRLDRQKILHNKLLIPTIIILVLATISVFVSPNKIAALGIWKAYFLEPIIFFFCLISIVKDKKTLINIFYFLGISAIYLSLLAMAQKFFGFNYGISQAFLNHDGTVDRATAVFGYPNALGLYLGPIVILYVLLLWEKAKGHWALIFKIAVIVLSFLAIVLAQSEGAIFSIVAVCLLMALINKKLRLWALLILVAGVILFFAHQGFHDWLMSKLFIHDYSGGIRRLMWQETLNMLKYNWLWGAGLAGYQVTIIPYHVHKFFEIYLYPHNIILNFWSELGLLGLLSFAYLAVKNFFINIKSAIKNQEGKLISFAIMAILLQMIIHGLVDAPYFKNDLSVMFWLFMAATVIISTIKKEKTN